MNRRRLIVMVVTAVLTLGAVIVWRIAEGFGHWNGRTVSITNECGYDVYADNNHDGFAIPDGSTVVSEHASRSHELTISLWRGRGGDRGQALVVELRGDSNLSGDRCP
jgi:hypothetical protein